MSTAAKRSCGSCTMCCRVPSVEADDGTELKPVDTWCQHCTVGRGCGIYATRPRACRTYTCVWLGGGFEDDDRPDRSKLLVSLAALPVETEAGLVTTVVLEIHECAPGALSSPRAARMLAVGLLGQFPVALAPFDRSPVTVLAGERQRELLDPERAASMLALLEGVAATL